MITLARRVADVRGSAIRDLLTLTARPEVISLAGGLPAADLAAARADRRGREPGARRSGARSSTARPRASRRCARTVAAHESARCGRTVGPSDVVVTSGSQQALDLLARALLDPGDPVVVEDPAYVGALQVFQAAGADLHPGCRSTPTACASTCSPTGSPPGLRPRLVHTVSSFHNPRGVTLAPERRRRAGRAGRPLRASSSSRTTRTDCSRSTAHRAQPVAAYGDRVLRLGSASKIVAPALRVGWLTGPPAVTSTVIGAVERLKQGTDLCGSSLTQAIAAELLADTAWLDAHLTTTRAVTAARARAFTAAVADRLPDVTCTTPTGGMFCWLEFPRRASTPSELLPAGARRRRRLRAGRGVRRARRPDQGGPVLLRLGR